MGVARSFDGLAEPTAVIVGDASDLCALLPAGTRVVSVAPLDGNFEPMPVALLVLDARRHDVSTLASVRASPEFRSVPAVVVAHDDEAEDLAAIGADDIVSPPFERSVPRRLATLIKLGRATFALWFVQQVLEQSVSGVTIADSSLPGVPIVYANSVFERITGYSEAHVYGQNMRFLQRGDCDPEARATLREAVREQRRAHVTLLNYRRDGTAFWNELTVFPVRTPAGRPLRWVGGVQHDVTTIIEARAEIDRLFRLMLDRQRFDHAILDGIEAGIITTDAGGAITFINRYARDFLGRRDPLDGKAIAQLLQLDAAPGALLGERGERRWSHAMFTDEASREIDITVSRAEEGAPEELGFFVIFHDRAVDKQIEMEHRRFERLAAMGTMVAGFAHEVRNPMASLRSLTESIADELDELGITMPHTDRMLKVIERVEILVRTSLLFGRPAPPRRAPHRPWVILSSAISALLPRTRRTGQQLEIESDADLPDVFIDDAQLVQVLIIFLNNALDVCTPDKVLLRASHALVGATSRDARRTEPPPQAFVRFDVRDAGPGIPPDIMGRIFDPFFTTKPQGIGLGLSIAQQIVTDNGGRIELVSECGGPTTFSVLVPVAVPLLAALSA